MATKMLNIKKQNPLLTKMIMLYITVLYITNIKLIRDRYRMFLTSISNL